MTISLKFWDLQKFDEFLQILKLIMTWFSGCLQCPYSPKSPKNYKKKS